jgi:hypothetical protein
LRRRRVVFPMRRGQYLCVAFSRNRRQRRLSCPHLPHVHARALPYPTNHFSMRTLAQLSTGVKPAHRHPFVRRFSRPYAYMCRHSADPVTSPR